MERQKLGRDVKLEITVVNQQKQVIQTFSLAAVYKPRQQRVLHGVTAKCLVDG